MGILGSIILISVGAILTFATDLEVSGFDLKAVGIILMVAGALGLIMVLFVFGPRRQAQVVVEPSRRTTRGTIVEE